jgi:hypothetical protein
MTTPAQIDEGAAIHLFRAVVVRAIRDFLCPPRCLSLADREEAAEFIHSENGIALIAWLARIDRDQVLPRLMRPEARELVKNGRRGKRR